MNRFIQPDTIVPNPAHPQSWNRYSYVLNNPINVSDPSGHYCVGDMEGCASEPGQGPATSSSSNSINARGGGKTKCKNSDPDCELGRGRGEGGTGPVPPIITARTVTAPPVITQEPPTVKFWSEAYKWIAWLEKAALYMDNYGIPAYRHAKGVIPGGPFLEFGLGALTTGIGDLNNPELTLAQRIVRPVVVGAENAVIDMGATAVATWLAGGAGVVSLGTGPGAAAVAGTVFVGASYGLSRAGDAIAGALNRRFLPDYFPD